MVVTNYLKITLHYKFYRFFGKVKPTIVQKTRNIDYHMIEKFSQMEMVFNIQIKIIFY